MLLFAMTLLAMLLAAAGLAVGALRGRPLLHGGCREARLTGAASPRCGSCALAPPAGAAGRGS
jgi:hypothetical protein